VYFWEVQTKCFVIVILCIVFRSHLLLE